MSTTTAPPEQRRLNERPELVGLGALVLAGVVLAAVGAQWISGPVATFSLALALAGVVLVVWTAVAGSPDAKRRIAPYGLLKPGMLWLALFYLAPLITLLRLSLSTLPSRFAVEADFDWNIGNYTTAFTDFAPQFGRAFLYAGTATILTIAIGFPLAYVIAFRGGKYKTLLLGLMVVAVCVYLWLSRLRSEALLVIFSVIGGTILSTVLKMGYDRPRPDLTTMSVQFTSSFPSGHAMLSAVTFLTLGAVLSRLAPTRTIYIFSIGLAVFLTLLVGTSRVYMGVHYPSDVLAGWCLGAAWALLCNAVAASLQRHGQIVTGAGSE